MRINSAPQIQTNYRQKSPAFTSIYYQGYTYRDAFGVKRETQNSTCRRNDLDYGRLAKISKERFKDFDRVNIMPMNVSDATELYFISKYMLEENGFDVFEKKYSPIYATDVCKEVINTYPKKSLVHLFSSEPEELNVFGEPMFKPVNILKYPQHIFNSSSMDPLFKLEQKFQPYFKFGVMDFQERLAKLNDEGNSIVLIRNCLKQSFGDIKSSTIAYQLASKLKGASLFITGDYDRGMRLFESAIDDNFVEIEHNIWARKDYQEKLAKMDKPELKYVPYQEGSHKGFKYLFNCVKGYIKR